jgi:hypothetical protein
MRGCVTFAGGGLAGVGFNGTKPQKKMRLVVSDDTDSLLF